MLEEEKQKSSLEEKVIRGGLRFPLDYEDISVLDASYIGAYMIQLSEGAAVIYDPKIKSTSIVVATHRIFQGTVGVLSAYTDNGVAYIVSSSTSDTSIVNVLIKY